MFFANKQAYKIRARQSQALSGNMFKPLYMINRWTLGFIGSFLFIWFISAFFCNSLVISEWNEALKQWVPPPGTSIYHRSEGHGKTVFGKFGIPGIPDLSAEKNVILLLGDSFVEALQVDDDAKTAQQLTAMMKNNNIKAVCAGKGSSGDNIADYIMTIRAFEHIAPSIHRYIIFLGSISDVLPDQPGDSKFAFKSDRFEFVEMERWDGGPRRLRSFLYRMHLDFLWYAKNDLSNRLGMIDFLPSIHGKADKDSGRDLFSEDTMTSIGAFIAQKIAAVTSKPVMFVYAPQVPRIYANHIVFDDPESNRMTSFADALAFRGVRFINMQDSFCKFFRSSGRFPRGFSNSRPGEGHLNRDGHRLVAEEIFRHSRQNF